MSYMSDADIDQHNSFPPAETPAERLAFKKQGVCPNCGNSYLWANIPWNAGSCVRPSCRMHDPTQLRDCAICKVARWRCSC